MNIIINTSDQHYGHNKQLLQSYHKTMDRVIDNLSNLKNVYQKTINRLYWVFNGDIISGTAVYRHQDKDNIFSDINSQIQVAAFDTFEIVQRIRERIGKNPIVLLVRGTHDADRKENNLVILKDKMMNYGIKARFEGTELTLNIGYPKKPYYIYFTHGLGGKGDYGKASNNMKRKLVKAVIDRMYEEPARIVRLACCGHFHTLGYDEEFLGVPMCVSGGWHAPSENYKILTMDRTGVFIFKYDTDGFDVIPIIPDKNEVKKECKDSLEYKSFKRLVEVREKALQYELDLQKYEENGDD